MLDRVSRCCLLLLLAVLLPACAFDGAKVVELKGNRFLVELALDPETRAKGLMHRDSMPERHGMLFVFPFESRQAFWMKNTRIPLDILYFNRDRGFVSAAYRTPACSAGDRCPSYPSEGPALYVLELNAGVGAALNLSPGDQIELPSRIGPVR